MFGNYAVVSIPPRAQAPGVASRAFRASCGTWSEHRGSSRSVPHIIERVTRNQPKIERLQSGERLGVTVWATSRDN
jgi:hypothetical protein